MSNPFADFEDVDEDEDRGEETESSLPEQPATVVGSDDDDDDYIPRRRTRQGEEPKKKEKKKKKKKDEKPAVWLSGDGWKAISTIIVAAMILFFLHFGRLSSWLSTEGLVPPDLAFQQEAESQGKLMDELVEEYRAAKDDAARMLVEARAKDIPELTPIFQEIDKTRKAEEAMAKDAAEKEAKRAEITEKVKAAKSKKAGELRALAAEALKEDQELYSLYPHWETELRAVKAYVISNAKSPVPLSEADSVRFLAYLLLYEDTYKEVQEIWGIDVRPLAAQMNPSLETEGGKQNAAIARLVRFFRLAQYVATLEAMATELDGVPSTVFLRDVDGYDPRIELGKARKPTEWTSSFLPRMEAELKRQPALPIP